MSNTDIILNLFRNKKNLTDLEIQNEVTINPNSIRPLRLKLLRRGLIRKTDERRRNYAVYEFNENKTSDLILDLKNTLKKIESQIEHYENMKIACLKAIDLAKQV